MKKRVLSLLMALVMCLTMVPAPVLAAEGTANGAEQAGTHESEKESDVRDAAASAGAANTQSTANGIAVQAAGDAYQESTDSGVKTITLTDYTGTTQISLQEETVLVLNGKSTITCDVPILTNGYALTIRGSGSLELTNTAYGYMNSAIYDGNQGTSTNPVTLESGELLVRSQNAIGICVGTLRISGGTLRVEVMNDNLGIRALQNFAITGSGATVYVTTAGSQCISRSSVFWIQDGYTILYADTTNASEADMQVGKKSDARDEHKTVFIGTSDAALLSAGTQNGTIYQGSSGTATFSLSGLNLNWNTLKAEWDGEHPGLTAKVSGKKLTITADTDAVEGTYPLTLTADGTASGKTAAKTVNVVVSGVPLTIVTQPEDNVMGRKNEGDFNSVFISVAVSQSDGVTYQWKLEGGTELSGQTDARLFLANIPESALTQDAVNTWKSTARVYCTATRNGYAVDSQVVTVIVSTCTHQGHYDTDGICRQCGARAGDDYYFVDAKGIAYQGYAIGSMIGEGETIYLLRDIVDSGIPGPDQEIPKNAIIDLKGHEIGEPVASEFQNTTVRNGIIQALVLPGKDNGSWNKGTLTLEDITVTEKATISDGAVLTVGENCVFKGHVTISGETRLNNGTFEKGVADENGNTIALLADGYACQDENGSIRHWQAQSQYDYMKIVPHTCKDYVYGECGTCGRICSHPDASEDGICGKCGMAKNPFSIGSVYYATLEAALAASEDGDTVLMRSDYRLATAAGIDIGKNITLDLGGHTLSELCGADTESTLPIRITGTDVTIQNGTIQNDYTAKTVGTVRVVGNARLTVKDATIMGGTGYMGISADGLYVNGEAEVASGDIRGIMVLGGTLTVTGGNVGQLTVYDNDDETPAHIRLSGGQLAGINGVALTAERMRAMLADFCAYADLDGDLIKWADMTGSDAVQVVKCTHPDGITASMACPYCGDTCGHGDFTSGVCAICGYPCPHSQVTDNICGACHEQMVVKVTDKDGADRYYAKIYTGAEDGQEHTMQTLLPAVKDGDTITLLENGLNVEGTLDDGKTVTLALNGKNTLAMNSLTIQDGAALKVTGNGSNISSTFLVGDGQSNTTGTLDLSGWNGGTVKSISVHSGSLLLPEGKSFRIDSLRVYYSVQNVKLTGGSYGTIRSGSRAMTVSNLLAEGYVFRNADGSYVKSTDYIRVNDGPDNVTVVECGHENLPADFAAAVCPYCGAALAATVKTAGGQITGYTTAQAAADNAAGGTATLLAGVESLTASAALKLDCGGYTVESLTVSGDVTLESLLPEGYAFKSRSSWVSDADLAGKTELTKVTTALAPITSVAAAKSEITITYGEGTTQRINISWPGEGASGFTLAWKDNHGNSGENYITEMKSPFTFTPSPRSAGEYIYTLTFTKEGYSKSCEFKVTVNKADVRVTKAPAANTLTYNGTEQPLVTAGRVNGGTMQYSLDGKKWSADIPTGLDAGSYTVRYKVVGDENYNDGTSEGKVDVVIGQKEVALTGSISAVNRPYEANRKTVMLNGDDLKIDGLIGSETLTLNLSDGTIETADAGKDKPVTYTLTLADGSNGGKAGNYKLVSKLPAITVEITKAQGNVTAPTAIENLAYNGKLQTLVKPGSSKTGTVEYSLTSGSGFSAALPQADEAGSYTVYYRVVGNDNYEGVEEASLSVTIARRSVAVPGADGTAFAYNGAEQTYGIAESALYTVSGNVQKDAGTHTVTVKLNDSKNNMWDDGTDADKTYDFVIAQASLTVTALNKSAYANSAAPDLSKPEQGKDYIVEGLLADDLLLTAPSLAYAAAPDMRRSGAATIVIGGADAGINYTITYVDGTLTVRSRPSSGGASSGRGVVKR